MIPLRRPDIFAEPRPLFATCDAGLEDALVASLEAMGAEQVTPVQRGAGFFGDRELCWRANLLCRVASRVLVPIAEFPAADKEALLEGAAAAPWSSWFQVSKTIAVDATSEASALDHTGYIAQVVKDGICDHFREVSGRRPDVDKKFPDVRINARIERDHCILSLDSSGVSLDRRGYRIEAGAAPLRETLAAGCLFASGWTAEKVLVDPMCGAGTLLVEAALIATNTPPGLRRGRKGHFSFTHWYGHNPTRFAALLDALEADIRPAPALIFGSDVDPEVLGQARRNAERAGVEDAITLAQQPISAARPPAGVKTGVVVCNPPYGHRIGGDDDRLQALYATLGRTLKFEFGGWDVWLLIGEGAPVRNVGMSPSHRVHLRNGPIPCELMQYEVFAGRPSLVRDDGRPPRGRSGSRDGRPPRARRSGARDDRPPRARRSGARDDRRGPPRDRDDRRGPPRDRDDRRGPPRERDDRRGPPRDRDDRRGPPRDRDDRRGPPRDRDDRRGPPRDRDDRRGPPRDRDDRRGPPRDRDDRRGPPRDRDDRRGPPRDRDDRRGPPRDRDDRRGPPRDRDDRRGPPRDRDDRRGPPRDRDDRRGPPRDRDDRRGPPRDRDDRRGPPRDRDDRRGPPRDRDDRRGPPRDRDDRRGPPRDRDDRRGPPRNRDDRRGPPRDRDDRRGPPRGRPPRDRPEPEDDR